MIWDVPLGSKPNADLFAIGIHGPDRIDRFRIDSHWTLHLYTYSAPLWIDGREFQIRPGCASLNPPGVETRYHFQDKCVHACAHFRLEDGAAGDRVAIPALQDLGPRFGTIYQGLEEAIGAFPLNRQRAEVRLWDILWQIAENRPDDRLRTDHVHPAVARAAEIINLRLGEEITVADLVRETGFSHNHLTRLFRLAYGKTIVGYIRDRRAAQAKHLLLHTHISIKTIAAMVGVPDTRFFNKIIHQTLGASPQEVRRRAQA